ncbi:MAG: hypothetical protein KJ874_11040, partial [Acidobacteria bacterium]|nr:hypothetical protein [Acidobacteriota bacterium]
VLPSLFPYGLNIKGESLQVNNRLMAGQHPADAERTRIHGGSLLKRDCVRPSFNAVKPDCDAQLQFFPPLWYTYILNLIHS